MRNQVAAYGHELRVGLMRVHGSERGLEQDVGSIDTAGMALLLESLECLLLIG